MSNKRKAIIVWAAVGAAVLIAGSCRVHFYRSSGSVTILWHADRAQCYLEVWQEGHEVSYLHYPWLVIKEYFGAPEKADETSGYLVVIEATTSGVERHVLKLSDLRNEGPGGNPSKYTPIEGRIYALCSGPPRLSWWSGDHFEQATQEESRRLDGINRLTVGDIGRDENGWSRREFRIETHDYEFTAKISDEVGLSVRNIPINGSRHGTVSIDLLRAHRASERLWTFNALPARISKAEYRRAFDAVSGTRE